MNLDDAQRKKVAGWVAEGLRLSEIQNKLASELGLHLTYLELRFLLDDLKLQPKDTVPSAGPLKVGQEPSGEARPGEEAPEAGTAEDFSDEAEEGTVGGAVSVQVDQVSRPGALASGRVTFSDGQSAEWYLDDLGRLGLAPKQKAYRPSQSDLLTFQRELQTVLAKLGF